MLWKALQYFWVKSWDIRRRDDITLISGETYWIYRLYAEGLLFALATASFFGLAFYGEMVATDTLAWCISAGLATAMVGLMELVRLTVLLREQVAFAELFYD